jgi:hypothetical protein
VKNLKMYRMMMTMVAVVVAVVVVEALLANCTRT